MTQDPKYGLPKLKKYPMPDAAHVRSAIKFFNYVTPSNEQELANAILTRMEEYGISPDSMNVGDENRFKKYLIDKTELKHHGIKGQRWGVRRFQNPDGSLTPAGKRRVASKEQRALNNLDRRKAQQIYDVELYEKRAARKVKKLENKDYSNSIFKNREKRRKKTVEKNKRVLDWSTETKKRINTQYKTDVDAILNRCKKQHLDVKTTENGRRWVDTHYRIKIDDVIVPVVKPTRGNTIYKVRLGE